MEINIMGNGKMMKEKEMVNLHGAQEIYMRVVYK